MPLTVQRGQAGLYLALWFLEGLAGLFLLLQIPADPKHAILFGFSASRLALVALFLLGVGLSAGLALAFLSAGQFGRASMKRLSARLQEPGFVMIVLLAAALLFLAGLLFLLHTWAGSSRLVRPTLVRLVPLAIWSLLGGGHTLLFVRWLSPPAWRSFCGTEAWRGGRVWLAVLFILAAAWIPRGLALDHFVSTDEPLRATRAANFYTALRRGDLAATYQSEHPGVTVLWAGALGLAWRFPGFDQFAEENIGPGRYENLLLARGFRKTDLLAAGRLILAIATVLCIGLGFVLFEPLIGFAPAVAGFLLIALDPFHIAHSRLLNMDAPLASLMLLSLAAFLNFQHRQASGEAVGARLALMLSGAAAGLSWLTKTPGLFLIPVFGLLQGMALWQGLRESRRRAAARRGLLPLVIWTGIGALTFLVLWPAMWIAPIETLSRMLAGTFGYAVEGHQGSVFFNGRIVPDGQMGAGELYFYPLTFLWRTTPVALAGLVAAVPAWMFRSTPFESSRSRRAATGLLLLAAVYFLLMNLGAKKFDRYFLPAALPLNLIAGMGLAGLAAWLARTGGKAARSRPGLASAVLVIAIIGQGVPLLQTYPYYLSYYNPLLGGSQRAPLVMMIGWGEGLDQAARYLNEKSHPERLSVISWYNQGSFSYYFQGRSEHIPSNQELRPERLQEILDMDYAVIYIHQWQRQTPRNLLELLAGRVPERSIWIDGLEYVRIYRLGQGE